MTQNPMQPAAEPAWSEPPRRAAGSWNAHARYGASLVATLLGAYLYATTSFNQVAQALVFSTGPGIEYTLMLLSRYVFAVLVLAFAFAIAPTSPGRRIGTASAVVLVGILVAVFTVMRFTGPLPGGTFWNVALNQVFVAALLATAGWLVVRERPALSYLFLIPIVLVGLIPVWMVTVGLPWAAAELVTMPLALVFGVAIAWIAHAMSAAMRR